MATKTAVPTKHCARCGLTKPITEFREKTDARRPGKVYHYSYCKTCSTSYNQEYRATHEIGIPTPIKVRKSNGPQASEVKTYCEICLNKGVKLYADFDLKMAKFQGTICGPCATGLEHFGRNRKMLQRALGYLAR